MTMGLIRRGQCVLLDRLGLPRVGRRVERRVAVLVPPVHVEPSRLVEELQHVHVAAQGSEDEGVVAQGRRRRGVQVRARGDQLADDAEVAAADREEERGGAEKLPLFT